MKPDNPVDVVVLRKGKKETLKGLALPEARKPDRPAADKARGLFPNLPIVGQAGRGVSIASQRNGDDFVVRRQEGNLSITVKGKVVGAKAEPSDIQIQDGDDSHKCQSLDKVPERYRDTVKKMLDTISGNKIEAEIR